jgi:hypothetical protein
MMKTTIPVMPEETVIKPNENQPSIEPRLIFSNESEQVYAFDKPEHHYVRILLSESQEVVEHTCTCGETWCSHQNTALALMRSQPAEVEGDEEDEFDEDAVARILERMQTLDMGQLLTLLFDTIAQHPELIEFFQNVLPPIDDEDEEEPLFS